MRILEGAMRLFSASGAESEAEQLQLSEISQDGLFEETEAADLESANPDLSSTEFEGDASIENEPESVEAEYDTKTSEEVDTIYDSNEDDKPVEEDTEETPEPFGDDFQNIQRGQG